MQESKTSLIKYYFQVTFPHYPVFPHLKEFFFPFFFKFYFLFKLNNFVLGLSFETLPKESKDKYFSQEAIWLMGECKSMSLIK